MSSAAINIGGLILNIVGVGMIFKWGPPQPFFFEAVGLAIEDATPMPDGRTAKEHATEAQSKKLRYKRISGAGLLLIGLGFAAQLYAAIQTL